MTLDRSSDPSSHVVELGPSERKCADGSCHRLGWSTCLIGRLNPFNPSESRWTIWPRYVPRSVSRRPLPEPARWRWNCFRVALQPLCRWKDPRVRSSMSARRTSAPRGDISRRRWVRLSWDPTPSTRQHSDFADVFSTGAASSLTQFTARGPRRPASPAGRTAVPLSVSNNGESSPWRTARPSRHARKRDAGQVGHLTAGGRQVVDGEIAQM